MGATISKCGIYRYQLWREIGGRLGPVLFIMLNPSTADAEKDDPTIRRCIGYAKKWGHDRLFVGNLFAYRSTDPKNLRKADNPVGDDNNRFLTEMANKSCLVIAAWGTNGSLHGRDREVIGMLDKDWNPLWVLRKTKKGYPSHPLYLPKNIKPIRYSKKFYGRCNTCEKLVYEGDDYEQTMGMESWVLFCSRKCQKVFTSGE